METYSKLFKSIGKLALATVILLLLPLLAMQYTNEVMWTLSDFIVGGILIFSTGVTYLLVTQKLAPKIGNKSIYKIAVGFTLFSGLFLIWANLAVGIIGAENNPFNLIYFGVIAIGIIGSLITRFKPKEMSHLMFATAICLVGITINALTSGMQNNPDSSVFEILGINGLFISLFLVSALLFRYTTGKITNTDPNSSNGPKIQQN
ncbi:hypothetical protein [Fodinibius saliphilus]|uniref:hypothetical protein n=1 Tax=Fodinibius saliphilus TaxID=1920650 RepID=UPI001108B00E|nr:hypothetical protein [Fodinibius saliphilus]